MLLGWLKSKRIHTQKRQAKERLRSPKITEGNTLSTKKKQKGSRPKKGGEKRSWTVLRREAVLLLLAMGGNWPRLGGGLESNRGGREGRGRDFNMSDPRNRGA